MCGGAINFGRVEPKIHGLSLNLVESWQLLWATASSVGRQGTTARLGRPPCPSAASRGAREFVCSPQTATKPPRKPHNPRRVAGGTPLGAGRKVASCASCARSARPMGRWRQGGEVEEAAPEKFARSPCHHTAVSAPIAPASVCGATGVFLHWLTYSSLFLSRPFGGQPTDYLTI